jgi:Tol biopolymer transport system component
MRSSGYHCLKTRGGLVTIASLALLWGMTAGERAAASSPGVSRIAYSSFQSSSSPQIWLTNPDGTNMVRLTSHPAGGDGAGISPDGSLIVFESPRFGYAMLFLIGTDGTNEHRLLSTSFYGQSGTWSPDGTHIAFTHSSNNGGPGGTGTTWVVHPDGTGLLQLSSSSTDDWIPCWSPDGNQIAFQSNTAGTWQIFVMNADGTGRQQITYGSGSKTGPRWSPDGTRFAYTLLPDPAVAASSIHVTAIDGTGDFALTDTTGINGRPCWSPDGSEIAFHSNRYGNFRIFRIHADGTDIRPVTAGGTAPGDWCGDWRMVAVPPAAVGGPSGKPSLDIGIPNPMRVPSTVRFTTLREDETRLEIFDVSGRSVRTLLREHTTPGTCTVSWDGRSDRGDEIPAGTYFCRLANGGVCTTKRFVFLK